MILMPIIASIAVMNWKISKLSLLMRTGAVINRSPDKISTELLQKEDRWLLRNRGFLWEIRGVGKLKRIGLLPVGQWPILYL
jgi:hypothetical protein